MAQLDQDILQHTSHRGQRRIWGHRCLRRRGLKPSVHAANWFFFSHIEAIFAPDHDLQVKKSVLWLKIQGKSSRRRSAMSSEPT